MSYTTRTFLILLTLVVVGGCRTSQLSSDETLPPVLIVDDAHSMLSTSSKATRTYHIRECPKIFIDAAHYNFAMPDLIRGKPLTEIWIATKGDSDFPKYIYDMPWEVGKTHYELSTKTLKPRLGPAFSGFKAGQKWTISISAEYEPNGPGSQGSLSAWYGTIEVR
jgi:hypothetical protein